MRALFGCQRKYFSRRDFLAIAGTQFAAAMTSTQLIAFDRTDYVYASAYITVDGAFGVAMLSEDGILLNQWSLPARAHDIVWRRDRSKMVVFARRPGTFAAVIDPSGKDGPIVFNTPPGRHFYGHGCFSKDGRLLFATENDFENALGVIGVYDATCGYCRVGEFASGGLGPHDLLLSPDGKTLIVANGGIETHPDFPRVKLNVSGMQPNLALIDTTSGHIVHMASLPASMHRLSIRHLALDQSGTIWFACQDEGDVSEVKALAGSMTLDGDICLLDLPLDAWAPLRGYIGSIACTNDGSRLALTSPRGNTALKVNIQSHTIFQQYQAADICGVSATRDDFLFSTGSGIFSKSHHNVVFDNHIASHSQSDNL